MRGPDDAWAVAIGASLLLVKRHLLRCAPGRRRPLSEAFYECARVLQPTRRCVLSSQYTLTCCDHFTTVFGSRALVGVGAI
jgi:hypothetical protein